jgi:hypothetical protein
MIILLYSPQLFRPNPGEGVFGVCGIFLMFENGNFVGRIVE